EVFRIADRVQVLRDGSEALNAEVKDTDRPALIEAMVGRHLTELPRPVTVEGSVAEKPVSRWKDAASTDEFAEVSIEVRIGEIVAIYGKLGSGASEVGETAFGLRPVDVGTLVIAVELDMRS